MSEKKIVPDEYTTHIWIINEAYYYFDLWYSIKEIMYSIILNLTKNIKNKYLKKELESWLIKKKG